jgi:hypothetical protein
LVNPSTKSQRGRKRNMDDFEAQDVEEIYDSDLMNVMGFRNFGTTKLKHVEGTDCSGFKFKQKTEYRQYINRDGGFNRELSPTRAEKKKIKMSLKKAKPSEDEKDTDKRKNTSKIKT